MYTLNGGNKRALQHILQNQAKVERKWYVVDATDVPLGRLSTVVASVLRGKNKPTFTPNVDTGDLWGKVIHFDFSPWYLTQKGCSKGLNSMLPLDCEVIDCKIVSDDFHAPLPPTASAICIIVSRSWFYRSFQTFLHGTLQIIPWYQADRKAMPMS